MTISTNGSELPTFARTLQSTIFTPVRVLTHVIQVALTLVFLLTALAALLNVFSTTVRLLPRK